MSLNPDGRLMTGTYQNDVGARRAIETRASKCTYVCSVQSAINVCLYENVIYENGYACTHQTNKITRHWRQEKYEDVFYNVRVRI